MQYAVFTSGGKQYKVKEGDVIDVDKLSTNGDKITFDRVLLFVSDIGAKVGKPILSDIKVIGKSLGNVRGKKIRVSKYKSKVRYRRSTGFRADYTKVRIEKIETGEKSRTSKKPRA